MSARATPHGHVAVVRVGAKTYTKKTRDLAAFPQDQPTRARRHARGTVHQDPPSLIYHLNFPKVCIIMITYWKIL